jgi:DNA-binding transcriptional ArsR family regulator
VLDSFLRLLGVAGDRIPHSLDGRTTLYRRLLAETGALVVLDDVADARQLRPLLPRSRTSRALVTSRRALNGVGGTKSLTVPGLGPDESVELLRRTAGPERVEADSEGMRQIADLLGHLPLALSIIGRHMHDHPGWPLADYYWEPLTTLTLEGGLRAALTVSDQQLTPGARRLLRLLALHPVHDIDASTAAALADESATTVRRHLDALAEAHLIRRLGPGVFRLHGLVHAYAEERIGIDEPASRIRQALVRVLGHYRSTSEGTSGQNSRPNSSARGERSWHPRPSSTLKPGPKADCSAAWW